MVTWGALACPALAQRGFDTAAEREIVNLVNQERAKAGLPALALDDRLTQAAREHTLLMAQNGTLSHQFQGEPPLTKRLAATGLRFSNDGENVALDSGGPVEAHRGLMNSPGHRANILRPAFDTIGVGVVHAGDLIYVTQDFAHRLQAYTPPQAENAAAQAFSALRRNTTRRPLERRDVPQLRRLACSMAGKDELNTRLAINVPGARTAVAYTDGEPGRLPSNAARLASDPSIKGYAVGACYAATEKYPSGTWWVMMVFY